MLNGSPALTTKSKLHDHHTDEAAASLINTQRAIPVGWLEKPFDIDALLAVVRPHVMPGQPQA